MAENEPNRPEDAKTGSVNETPTKEKAAPSKPLEADIKAPGDVVVSFDKINELANERKAAGHEAAQTAGQETKIQEAPAEKAAPASESKSPEKTAAHKGQPPKTEKTGKPDKEPKPEKAPKSEKSTRSPKTA